MSGEVPASLTTQLAGPLNHSRWLTLAIRLLELYTKTPDPSSSLIKVVTFIMKVYVPMWFIIKSNPKFTKGPEHMFKQIQLVNQMSPEVQSIVKPVVQRNSYLAHPSILLCSMLESDSFNLRLRAVEAIKQARIKPPKVPTQKNLAVIRKFEIPQLKWDCNT